MVVRFQDCQTAQHFYFSFKEARATFTHLNDNEKPKKCPITGYAATGGFGSWGVAAGSFTSCTRTSMLRRAFVAWRCRIALPLNQKLKSSCDARIRLTHSV